MSDVTILVADADATAREDTVRAITDRFPDANVLVADSFSAATDRLEAFAVDVVVTASDLEDGTGLELAARVREALPDADCFLYSRQADIDTDPFEDVVVEFVPKDAPAAMALLLDLVERVGPADRQAAYPLPADEAGRLAAVDRYTGETDRLVGPLSRLCALAVDPSMHGGEVGQTFRMLCDGYLEVRRAETGHEFRVEGLRDQPRDWTPIDLG